MTELARIEETDLPIVAAPGPREELERRIEVADVLAGVLNDRKLYNVINGKKHPSADGYQVLASLCDLSIETEWTRQLDDGWEARVVVKDAAGRVRGSAEQECRRTEKMWATRDSYALRGMAQTRAQSRAIKQAAGFVVKIAGFNPTPSEEMT